MWHHKLQVFLPRKLLKLFFNFRRTRIRKAAEDEFPGNTIPTFRSNPDAKKRLDGLVKRLSETCTVKEIGFEEGMRNKLKKYSNDRNTSEYSLAKLFSRKLDSEEKRAFASR